SPALSVLGSGRDLSSSPCNGRLRWKVSRGFQTDFQPSASRTVSISLPNPSDKSLGYFHSVRFADGKHFRFWAKLQNCIGWQQRHRGVTLISIGERKPLANSSTYFFHASAEVIFPARSQAKPAQ